MIEMSLPATGRSSSSRNLAAPMDLSGAWMASTQDCIPPDNVIPVIYSRGTSP